MPRLARVDVGGHAYHVINRAVMRYTIFDTQEAYALFERLLFKTAEEAGVLIQAFAVMPNHWHLLLVTQNDGDLGTCMHRLTNAHTRHVHTQTGTIGTGPLYQGRYKSFLVQNDRHFLTVLKYIERNPVRARLAISPEGWRWGSAWHRANTSMLPQSVVPIPTNYNSWLNTPEPAEELHTLRAAVNKGVPYGHESWVSTMVDRFGLQATQRSPGRPKK